MKGNILDDLTFEESRHLYRYNGEIIPSVSKQLKKFYKPFDTGNIATGYAKKHGLDVLEVVNDWKNEGDVANDKGHYIHSCSESLGTWIYNIRKQRPDLKEQITSVIHCWGFILSNFEDYVPLFVEDPLVSAKYMYGGTPDLVLGLPGTDYAVIIDYKTNKDLNKNFNKQKLLAPFDHFLDTPLNKYKLQIAHYQLMLEELGYTVIKRYIFWLKDECFDIEIEDLSQPLREHYDAQSID